MKEKKTFLKLFASTLAVLCFAIFITPSFAKAADRLIDFGYLNLINSEPDYTSNSFGKKDEAFALAKSEYFPNAYLGESWGKGMLISILVYQGVSDNTTYDIKVEILNNLLNDKKPEEAIRLFASNTAGTHLMPFEYTTGTTPTANKYVFLNEAGTEAVTTLQNGKKYIARIFATDLVGTPSDTDIDQAGSEEIRVYFLALGWAGGVPDAISTTQNATDGAGFDYYTILATAPEVAKNDPAYTLNPAVEDTEVRFVQTVSMTAGLANDGSVLDNDEVIILKMPYEVGPLAEPKTFANVSLQSVPAEEVTYTLVQKHVQDLAAGEWAAFVSGQEPERLNAQEKISTVMSNETYDIYYAVTVKDVATFTNTTRILLGPEATVEPPLDGEGSGAHYVATVQQDPIAETHYAVLNAKTDLGAGSDVGTLDYGYVNIKRGAEDTTKTLALTTDASELYAKVPPVEPKFMTYSVPFTVPNYADASLKLIDLNPTINDVKVVNKIAGGNAFKLVNEMVNPTEGGLYWVLDDGGSILPENAELTDGKTYSVFYTVAIDATSKKAESNVAVLTKTAKYDNVLPDNPPISYGPTYDQPGTTSKPSPKGETGAAHVVVPQSTDNYEEPAGNITYTPDAAGNSGPIQSFAYTGFTAGDSYIFNRSFTYASPADGSTEYVNADTLRLEKYAGGQRSTYNFTLISTPTKDYVDANIDKLSGQFWAVKDVAGDSDVEIGEAFVPGNYTIYFVIKDNHEGFDIDDTPGDIEDPNGLFAQASPSNSSSSSGCSVGGTSAYDMALIMLLALGLLGLRTLRVRTRKN